MATVDGGPVVAHAQAFADEINRRWGFTHILTYPGHQPDQQHALDSFQTRDVMLQLADWCTHDDVIDRYGIDYVIFNVDESTNAGEIYNREIARHWRTMEDRGSPTQNHHDHVHVSFNPTAAGPFGPSPTPPTPVHQEDDMAYTPGGNVNVTPSAPKGASVVYLSADVPTTVRWAVGRFPQNKAGGGWSDGPKTETFGPGVKALALPPEKEFERRVVSLASDHPVSWSFE